jgi:hypothetical protein
MAVSVDSLLGRLKELDNDHIIEFLGEMQITEYIHNPWFLGAMVVLAVCCLLFKWRVLLATIVGVTGLAWLGNYTAQQGTEVQEGLQSNSLIFFVGGGVLIVILMIYLVFIKEE